MNPAVKSAVANALRRFLGYRRLRHFERGTNVSANGDVLSDSWRDNGERMVSDGVLHTLACSDREDSATLRCRDRGRGGSNNLHVTELAAGADMHVETVGHNLAVMQGARKLLASRRILYVQFEYNAHLDRARAYLRDAFDLLRSYGFNVGKIHRDFVEQFLNWNYRLEWFEQTNYLAWRNDSSLSLPVEVTGEYLAHSEPS